MAITLAACHQPPGPAAVGTAAPDLAVHALNGQPVQLRQLRDSVVLLNVWATWCVPCRREVPELQALHQQYGGRGLRVVGLSVDDAADASDVVEFVKNYGLTYAIWLDPQQQVSARFGIPGVPASFLIDRSGLVRWRHLGPFKADNGEFISALQKTLGDGTRKP
jgi:peroxiredoxin